MCSLQGRCKPYKKFSNTELPLKVNSSQQEADSISQLAQVEKTTRSRDSPIVRNLILLFIEVTSLEGSTLAYHNKKLAVVPNLWTGSQYFWHITTRRWQF
jgi:hypothetical protein